MAWKPHGYTSVAPYLVVDGAQRTIDFLVTVFGAEPLRMHPMWLKWCVPLSMRRPRARRL